MWNYVTLQLVNYLLCWQDSIALKGRVVPQEVRDKLSKNSPKPFLGRHHTEESKSKNALAHMGKQYHLGHKHSDEAKRKMSEAKKVNLYLKNKKLN